MAFDASPSWSGFNYQGKVALYYALKLINAEPLGSDLSNRSLMLEDNEDFEIILDGNTISIHQVKAYNSSSYSKYSNALVEITLELSKHHDVLGKVHTWRKINLKPDTKSLVGSVKDDLNIILNEYRNSNPKIGNTTLEKAVAAGAKKSKQAAIIKSAFPEHSANDLFDTLNSIHTGLNNALTRLEAFIYDDGNSFCDLDDINQKIKSEISSALVLRNIPNTPEHLDKKFHYFLGVMDTYIIQRHQDKQEQEHIAITFNELLKALETDHEDIGIEYLACEFKELFVRMVDEYINDPEDYTEPVDNLCNLKESGKLLLSLSPKSLWAYFRNFCPHIHLDNENNTVNSLETDPTGTRHVLIKILHQINFERITQNTSNYKFVYQSIDLPRKNYLPTTITGVPRTSYIEKSIVKNPNMSEILFEVENLIYGGAESHTFSPASMMHTQAPQNADDELRPSKRDEILNSITLVPILMAKEALN